MTFLDGEQKDRFLGSIRLNVNWVSEERRMASELLKDPWILKASARAELAYTVHVIYSFQYVLFVTSASRAALEVFVQ